MTKRGMRIYFCAYVLLVYGTLLHTRSLTQNNEKACVMAQHLSRVQSSVASIQTYTFNENRAWKRIGSGCCYHLPGIVITRMSVVQGGDSIVVTFGDGEFHNACLVDYDPVSQVAVLKASFGGNRMATAGRTDTLTHGSCITILGNSLGVFPSVTLGKYHGLYGNGMIKLDGNVAPGNSGGPLFTEDGRLVGLLAGQKTLPGDEEKMIALALSIEAVNAALEKMSVRLDSHLGWVGMRVVDLTRSDTSSGVEVKYVVPRGPADLAHIAKGDTLVYFQGKPIRSAAQLRTWVRDTPPKKSVVFGVKHSAGISARRVKVHRLKAF